MDNENLCFLTPIDKISSPTHINASISLEGCFVTRLDNIYLLFSSTFEVTRFDTNFYLLWNKQDRQNRLYLVSLV